MHPHETGPFPPKLLLTPPPAVRPGMKRLRESPHNSGSANPDEGMRPGKIRQAPFRAGPGGAARLEQIRTS
jgi:hypothetical protein